MSKKKNRNTGGYDRQMIRKILRNRLKTNRIKNAFHDKVWLKKYIKAI